MNSKIENIEFLQNIINALNDGVAVIDKGLNIVFANDWIKKNYFDSNLNKTNKCHELIMGTTTPCKSCPTHKTFSTGEPNDTIITLNNENNDTDYFHIFSSAVKDKDGNVEYVIEHFRKITEQVYYEKKLIAQNKELENRNKHILKSKNRIVKLLDTASDAIYFLNDKAQIIDTNLQAQKLTDRSKDELLGKDLSVIELDFDQERFLSFWAQKPYEHVILMEAYHFRKDNTRFPVEISSKKVLLENETCYLLIVRDTTERKKAENTLKRFFDMPMMLHLIIKTDSTVLNVNQGCEHILGYKKHEIIGLRTINYIHPDDLADSNTWISSLSKGTSLAYYENRFLHKDGSYRVLAWSASASVDEGIIYATAQDITKQKQIEDAIIESEANLTSVIESTKDRIWSVDKDYRILAINNNFKNDFAKYYGIHLSNGIRIIDYVAPSEKQKWKDRYDKALNNNTFSVTDQFNIANEIRHYKIKFNPIIRKNKITGVSVISFDITKRMKHEADLKDLNRRHTIAANSAQFGVWDFDLETDTLHWDDWMFRIYGVDKKDFGGAFEAWQKGVHPDDLAKAMQEVNETIHEQKTFDTTFRIIKPDGVIRHIKANAVLVKNAQGNPQRLVGVNYDITDRILFEQELIKAKKKAEESDRLKTAFLQNMSHEIRTPMNSIMGFANLMTETNVSQQDIKRYSDIIERGSKRMLETINDLMDMSLIEAKQIKIKQSTINLNTLFLEIFEMFKPETEEKKIELSYFTSRPDEQAYICSDKEKLFAILVNLIKNAIKYTPSGSITFRYTVDANRLIFSVEDTGIGIPEERKEAIFDRFVQADLTDTRAFEGSGLGLSICKSYLDLMDGKIWVESELNKGSTFFFSIPLNTPRQASTSQPQKGSELSKLNKLTILVAEDDEDSALHLSVLLRQHTKKMYFARNGIDAVDLAMKLPEIDLILMDIKMPGKNGYLATQEIRAFNKDVIIIAQTAFALSGDEKKALDAGCTAYLSKPIQKAKLIELLNQYF